MSQNFSVLFVCTANQCRSPMAEALFKKKIKSSQQNIIWKIESAGTWAEPGNPATTHSIQVMAKNNLDISKHRSRIITKEMLGEFDLILTMETGHKESIQVEFPEVAKRVFLLTEMADSHFSIPDPVGGSFQRYTATAEEIKNWIDKGFPKIMNFLSTGHF